MLSFYRRTLTVRVVAPIALLLTIVALAAALALTMVNTAAARKALSERARMMATVLSGGAAEALWNMDSPTAVALLASLAGDPDYRGSRLVGSDGKIFASNGTIVDDAPDVIRASVPVTWTSGGKSSEVGHLDVHLTAARSYQQIRRETLTIAGIGGMSLIVVCGVLLAIIRTVVRPIATMTGVMTRLADGSTEVEIPALNRRDEVGQMARAVSTFKDNAIEKIRLEAEQIQLRDQAEQERRQTLAAVAGRFDTNIGSVIGDVDKTAHQMAESATQMADSATDNLRLSGDATHAADQVSANMQTVATALEELAASIREISSQAQSSNQVADTAARRAGDTVDKMSRLVEDANRVGDVVTLISDIASQTNLLALNATIEAARAGEAGKGFAVVAGEVKNLANQTAKATDEIAALIAAIQSSTGTAAGEINDIARVIGTISEISASIAAAVEQQNAATAEISRAVHEAAMGTERLREDVRTVAVSAERNGGATGALIEAIHSLGTRFDSLKAEIDRFVSTMDAA
ncbi:MAG: methyl-accepting chemotaxis protein [Azospirillaceae bacterium]|nr:methyl-accepting chemotaxis protein [Azospirillaceae bacterium]